jgi:hypothetical protein
MSDIDDARRDILGVQQGTAQLLEAGVLPSDQEREPNTEDQAKWLLQRLKNQVRTTLGPALAALASIGLIHAKLVEKGILDQEEADKLMKDSYPIQNLMLDVEVGKMLSDDELVTQLRIAPDVRELAMVRCDEALVQVKQALESQEEK